MEKALDLIATTENISVISILLVLNPKHSSYWGENPSRNQDKGFNIYFFVVPIVPILSCLPSAI